MSALSSVRNDKAPVSTPDQNPLHHPGGLFVADTKDNILWADQMTGRITGWTPDELQGMHLGQIMRTNDIREIANATEIAGGLAPQRYPCRLWTKSGNRREISVSVTHLASPSIFVKIFLLRDSQTGRQEESLPLEPIAETRSAGSHQHETSDAIHDLRNLVHMVLMTLENLRITLDNPASQREPIRTLEETSATIKYLFEKLELLT